MKTTAWRQPLTLHIVSIFYFRHNNFHHNWLNLASSVKVHVVQNWHKSNTTERKMVLHKFCDDIIVRLTPTVFQDS